LVYLKSWHNREMHLASNKTNRSSIENRLFFCTASSMRLIAFTMPSKEILEEQKSQMFCF